jgi:hypothetical protein
MYGLRSDTNLNFLKGATLIQVCFGPHDLILNFTENVSISIYSAVSFGATGANPPRHTAYDQVSQGILRLLNKAVLDVGWTPDGMVSLTFEGNGVLEMYDDSTQYESYTIASPSGLIVV